MVSCSSYAKSLLALLCSFHFKCVSKRGCFSTTLLVDYVDVFPFFFLFWVLKRKLRSGVMTMTIDRDYDRTGGAQFDFFHRCLFLFEERVCFGRKNIQLLFETGIAILFLARWSVTGSRKMKYQSFWIIYYNLLNSLFLSSLSRMQQILLELYLKFLLE